jgi:hypothetical protein
MIRTSSVEVHDQYTAPSSSDRHQATVISPLTIAAEWDVARKDSNIAVELTESIKGETVNHH